MNMYVAFDVSLEFTPVCVMDEEGELVLEPGWPAIRLR
jgi:hypothetical protein